MLPKWFPFQFPPDLPGGEENGILLECHSCGDTSTRELSLIEREALDSTGIIAASCPRCEMPTYWTYVEAARRPSSPPPFLALAPPPRVERVKKLGNTRAHPQLKVDLAILVRDQRGATEIARTENVSVGGFGVTLSLDLAVGDIVTYVCPFVSDGQNIEQQAECRWSAPASPGGAQRIYAFRRV
ncbi:MAG: PilZ domain-containing protein [Acidobacteriia bacterium]|nr:PilZ domain-containing protein [Terriglobia bacterium]